MAKAKAKTAREVLAELRKRENEERPVIGALKEFDLIPQGLPTGNVSLDYVTGSIGFPRGRITECYGARSSGKTTSVLQAMGIEQKRIKAAGEDKIVVFFDYERSLDPIYMRELGIDVDDEDTFFYVKPRNLEHGMNIFRELTQSGIVSMAVFDSVAAMISEQEQNKDIGEVVVADRAKLLHASMRQIVGPIEEYGTAAIFLNHLMEAIPTSYTAKQMAARGIKQTAKPGGKALDYYASLQLRFERIGEVKAEVEDFLTNDKSKQVLGQKIRVTVDKNKTGNAFGFAELRIRPSKGFSQAYSVLSVLTSHKAVKVSTGWFSWPLNLVPDVLKDKAKDGVVKMQGEEAMVTALEASPEWLALAETEAKKILSSRSIEDTEHGKVDTSTGEVLDDDTEEG